MTYKLFNDFHQHKKAQWKEQVIKELKGKDFDETLLWRIDENVLVDAYCNSDDIYNIPIKSIQQVQNQRLNESWQYRESITFNNAVECNNLIINSLMAGANSFLIDYSGVCEREIEVKKLLRNIKLSDTPFFFKVENNCLDLLNSLQQIAPYQWKGGINYDGLALWMYKGIWDENYWSELGDVLRKVQIHPQFRVITISSHHFHNSGANVTQEIAYTLASFIETIDQLSKQNFSLTEIVQNIEFSISIGTNYFVEIAKIRALKFLFKKVLQSGYGLNKVEHFACLVHCKTSSFYSASITPHTNILRATSQSMAAIIGGCDALTVEQFDKNIKQENDFSKRVSRNISHILKEESYFDKVIDPSAGSYFIENLTYEIAEQALQLMMKIEKKGGIIEAFKINYIQNEIKRNFEEKEGNLASGKDIMVGVNKYRFDEEAFIEQQPIENKSITKDFELLFDKRISQKFEY
jgi:methylmalonyl-CoA mutase